MVATQTPMVAALAVAVPKALSPRRYRPLQARLTGRSLRAQSAGATSHGRGAAVGRLAAAWRGLDEAESFFISHICGSCCSEVPIWKFLLTDMTDMPAAVATPSDPAPR
jgi:hypothetical protein